jgi:DNA repair exonuclease SbcCD ATPase subunit
MAVVQSSLKVSLQEVDMPGKYEPLTMKQTKSEMIKAYNELLKKLEEKAASGLPEKKVEQQKKIEKEIVAKASTYTVESIVKDLADLHLGVGKAFSELSEQLVGEANKLKEIQQAITVQRTSLEELHDIHLAADTLSALVQEHEERRQAFETEMGEREETFRLEMEQKRAQWKKEQEEYEQASKERDAETKKLRQREEEEYRYNLALQRKKEKDAYEAEKKALMTSLEEMKISQEKALAEREEAVAAKEKQLDELTKKVESFPAELSRAAKEAEAAAYKKAADQAKIEAQLAAKDVEADRRVAELKIKTLETTVKQQEEKLQRLMQELAKANEKVQNIAVKAIEGASGARTLSAVSEIALEQAKKPVAPK